MRLQAFLRASAAPGRTIVRIEPFFAYLNPRDSLRFLNYAVPDDGADPDPASVEALREAFRSRDRLPRLEWVEEAAPRVAAAVAAAGMEEELRAPLMACAADGLVDRVADVDELVVAAVEARDVLDYSNVQRVGFGQPPLAGPEPSTDPRSRGGGGVLARIGGVAVAAAGWTAVIDGASEIVGVATAETWRGRRLAGAVTAAAARAAFAAGASVCVLSPGGEGAQRVYERAGFARAATILHWSDDAVGARP